MEIEIKVDKNINEPKIIIQTDKRYHRWIFKSACGMIIFGII